MCIPLGGPDGLRIVWGFADSIATGDWQSNRLRLIESLLPHVRQFVLVRQALAGADALGTGLASLGCRRCWPRAGRCARSPRAPATRKATSRWLLKQVYRKQGLSGQVALVQRVLAAYALRRR